MKKTQYTVYYENGNEETFYSNGILSCWAAATYYADTKALDNRINRIVDEESEIPYRYDDFVLNFKTGRMEN